MAHPAASVQARAPMAGRAVVVAALVVVVQALLVTLFAWPSLRLAPRDLPVVVAGPEQAATALAGQLAAQRPGGFAVTRVDTVAAADQALRDRRAYAAFVPGQQGMTLRLASAASPVAAQLLQAAVAEPGRTTVVDVVPVDADDPRGVGFAAGFLPLVLTSLLVGALLSFVVAGKLARLAGVVVYAALAGLAGAAILRYGLSVLPGDYLAAAGAIGLLALAMAGAVVGLGAALGNAGTALAALAFFAVGNPLSAVSAAPELLPKPWGSVGQLLPPGAGGTLLRSVSYFDGAGGARPAWVLVAWAAAGLALLAVGRGTAAGLRVGTRSAGTTAAVGAAATGDPGSVATGPVATGVSTAGGGATTV